MTEERWMAGKRERKKMKMKEVRVMADDGGTEALTISLTFGSKTERH